MKWSPGNVRLDPPASEIPTCSAQSGQQERQRRRAGGCEEGLQREGSPYSPTSVGSAARTAARCAGPSSRSAPRSSSACAGLATGAGAPSMPTLDPSSAMPRGPPPTSTRGPMAWRHPPRSGRRGRGGYRGCSALRHARARERSLYGGNPPPPPRWLALSRRCDFTAGAQYM